MLVTFMTLLSYWHDNIVSFNWITKYYVAWSSKFQTSSPTPCLLFPQRYVLPPYPAKYRNREKWLASCKIALKLGRHLPGTLVKLQNDATISHKRQLSVYIQAYQVHTVCTLCEDWLIDRLTDWLIDRFIDWMIDRSIYDRSIYDRTMIDLWSMIEVWSIDRSVIYDRSIDLWSMIDHRSIMIDLWSIETYMVDRSIFNQSIYEQPVDLWSIDLWCYPSI